MNDSSSPAAHPLDSNLADGSAHESSAERWWVRAEIAIEQASEWVNPILVKEARQALKANHFVVTFLLLLICGWGWSAIGILAQMPDIQFNGGGEAMLQGYFIVLIVPLLLVVPFSAFRSLAAEREDGTFELMSITALNARQIVTGKLASTTLQILLYTSALAPCIAFTYLLRGVDVLTICFVIYYTVALSLFLSILGLLVATLSRARHWQVLLSIGLLLGLFITMWTWGIFVFEAVFDERAFSDGSEPMFWLVQLALACGYVSLGVLMIQAAASRITFVSDNRATAQRVTILIQHGLLLGWMTYFFAISSEIDLTVVTSVLAGFLGTITGAFMIGESPQLSARVIRSLPRSAIGRILFTLFNPGSGTGYLFTVANITAVLAACLTMGIIGLNMGMSGDGRWAAFCVLIWAYMTTYLGFSRLLILFIRRFIPVPELLSIIVVAIVSLLGILVPLTFETVLLRTSNFDYSFIQASNWFWTLEQAERTDMFAIHPGVVILNLIAAGVMILANMVFCRKELRPVRDETATG
jgi:hypothetical protein